MRKVLLTGVTGFIGGATVAEFLAAGRPASELCVLVRAASLETARARTQASLARFVPLGLAREFAEACDVIVGDVTNVDWHDHPTLNDLTHTVHLAANTSFRSVRGVRKVNLEGTRALVERLRHCRKMERFLYVGTAYICGMCPPRIVYEDDYPHESVKHPVEYTKSKAECEQYLADLAGALPLVVARPSVVVGHTSLGCTPSASLFWYFRTLDLLRRTTVPLEWLNDVIPVDYAARALLHLLFKPALQHSRYHISAGESYSVTSHEISDVFNQHYGNRVATPYQLVDFATIASEQARLRSILGEGDADRMLMALELYERFSFEVVFNNTRLLEEGISPPPKFTDYLGQCIKTSAHRTVYEQMCDDD